MGKVEELTVKPQMTIEELKKLFQQKIKQGAQPPHAPCLKTLPKAEFNDLIMSYCQLLQPLQGVRKLSYHHNQCGGLVVRLGQSLFPFLHCSG